MHRPETDAARTAVQPQFERASLLRRRLVPTLAFACAGYCGVAQAERWSLEPAIETRVTWSDNVNFDVGGQGLSDTSFELIPRLALRGEGRRLKVFGTIAADALAYAKGAADSRILPIVDLTANLEAIERFFFVEAGVSSRQGAQDVFAARTDGGSTFNTITTTQYRLIPSFEGRVGSDIEYRLRSSNSWTSVSGAEGVDANGAYLGDHTLRVERRPSPFGWSIEGGRNETRFESALPPTAIIDSGRISLLYAFTATLNLGLRGGYEKTNLPVGKPEQTIYGGQLNWRPSERTDLSALLEERFFGKSWRFSFVHRMPRLAWNVTTSRDVASFPQAFLTLPATDNVAALLDAAFTTRFPDPTERSRVVADLIARQGLPSSLAAQTSLFNQNVSLVTSVNLMVAYLGVRNSIALAGFKSRSEDLPDPLVPPEPGTTQNVEQQGVSLTFSHQMTSFLAANLTGTYTRTLGIGPSDGQVSKQPSVRLEITQQVSPKTNAYAGGRVQKFESNVNVPPGFAKQVAYEHAAFVGLSHRF
jgi:uncharacterized protein (PEP-CTERM system associated)